MTPIRTLLALTGLCAGLSASLSAQAITSPNGMDTVEGNSSHSVMFGAIDRRFQQIDGSLVGTGPRSLSSMALRREGDLASATSTARTVDITVVLAHGDTGAISPIYADNYLGAATTVFATQTVNLPDWTALAAGPAPFDFVIPFDTPFSFNGTDALITDLTITNSSSQTAVIIDRQVGTSPFSAAYGVQTATGCTGGGLSQPFEGHLTAFNWGPNHPFLGQRLVISGGGAQGDTGVAANVCLDNPPIPFPGLLCAPYLFDLIVSFPMGATGPTGFTSDLTIDVEYNPLLEGVAIALQLLSIDLTQPGIPVLLSDVKSLVMPTAVTALDCHYLYSGPTSPFGTVFPNRGVVFEFL